MNDLPRPFVLLEGPAGGGSTHLAWGARSRRRLSWDDPADPAVLTPPGNTPLYWTIAYEFGLPPGVPRRTPAVPQPLVDLFEPENLLILDARGQVVRGQGSGGRELLERVVSSRADTLKAGVTGASWQSFTQSSFESAVLRAQELIAAGDIYQVNLSVAERWSPAPDPWQLYLRLRDINPSPWMGYADFGDWQLVCGYPELLVERSAGGRLRTRPIAGTRRKTGNAGADRAMREELQLDEKERAEHLMLVDLARNDVGRLAAYGTVEVAEREAVEEYSHVFHLVSEVRGTERPGVDHADVVASLFPGGTITGCPKIRAMEIIGDLEPVARGAYTGALGWIGGHDLQLNIVIRSAVVSQGQVVVQAGAGIVADSVPEREWKESLRKAAAVRAAFGRE
ncbi:MAG TPA: anthranilate synthase component I family protein [Gemmatimonadales bacterium]|nr:anthranilate synthase component I family protein [Gemmatimonadales bacterium]